MWNPAETIGLPALGEIRRRLRPRWLVHYQKVLVFRLDTGKVRLPRKTGFPLVFETAGLEEVQALHADPRMDLKVYAWEQLREKLEGGSWRVTLARRDGRAVGYALYSTTEMHITGTRTLAFDLPRGNAYGFRHFVRPDCRNSGVGKGLIVYQLAALKGQGLSALYLAVNHDNRVQIGNLRQLGADRVGDVTFIRSRFFHKVILSRGLQAWGLNVAAPDGRTPRRLQRQRGSKTCPGVHPPDPSSSGREGERPDNTERK